MNNYNFEVNEISTNSHTKSEAFMKIKTNSNYNWNEYKFTTTFRGNSFYQPFQGSLNVKAKILKIKCYNINKKRYKYYILYRQDVLQTFNYIMVNISKSSN